MANRTLRPGTLNSLNEVGTRALLYSSDRSTGRSLRKTVEEGLKSDSLAGIPMFKAICLRNEKDTKDAPLSSWTNMFTIFDDLILPKDATLVRIKARIPELAMIREPESYDPGPGKHQEIIDLHPTFVAKDRKSVV